MFSNTHTGTRHTTAYRDIGARTAIDGASPHKLVSMLYATLASEVACARGALARRDIGEKGRAISHAVRIIEEGLKAPLDLTAGGAIAANLNDLYGYLVHTLTMSNLRNNDAGLNECAALIETLREGWDGIAEQADASRRIAA